MPYNPNNELVAKAWLRTLNGVPTNSVATTLPRDNRTWAASGFVHIAGVIGGSSNLYYPLHEPVYQIDCYATNPDSDKVPWNEANQLATVIQQAVYDEVQVKKTLVLPAAYRAARVLEARVLSEPARRPDPASYAVYGLDLELRWIPL